MNNLNPKMVDTHMHVIPGVDDGAASLAMSMEMLEMAYEQGVRTVFATSHSSAFEYAPDETMERYSQLLDEAKRQDFKMEIVLGAEVRLTENRMDAIIQMLKAGRIPTLNGTKYVLTEFHPLDSSEFILNALAQMVGEGFIPVIAHAERYKAVDSAFLDALQDQLNAGTVMIQINAYSLAEEGNVEIREKGRGLLARHAVSFLGSDAHRTTRRSPAVQKGIQYLCESEPPEYAKAVLYGNAYRYLGLKRQQYGRTPGTGRRECAGRPV